MPKQRAWTRQPCRPRQLGTGRVQQGYSSLRPLNRVLLHSGALAGSSLRPLNKVLRNSEALAGSHPRPLNRVLLHSAALAGSRPQPLNRVPLHSVALAGSSPLHRSRVLLHSGALAGRHHRLPQAPRQRLMHLKKMERGTMAQSRLSGKGPFCLSH